jgi:RNA polymerase sigma factor (sigma-70 family)
MIAVVLRMLRKRCWSRHGGISRGSGRGEKSSPWLNRILLNEIKKQGRRARHPETPIEEAFQLRDSGRSPEQHAMDSETSAHLWNRVQALPEEQRIALVLRYYLGYTTPEIAQSTGWAQGAVRSRLSRGVAALRQTVDLSSFGDSDGKGDQG